MDHALQAREVAAVAEVAAAVVVVDSGPAWEQETLGRDCRRQGDAGHGRERILASEVLICLQDEDTAGSRRGQAGDGDEDGDESEGEEDPTG